MTTEGPAPARRVTRSDVARLAGVSTAVVSYTLNDGPKRVSPATRERVEAAILALGYRPNAAARALKLGTAEMLSLVVSDLGNPFFAEFTHEVELAARARGHALLVVEAAGRELAGAIERVEARQVDGMMVVGGLDRGASAAVERSEVPIVLLDQQDPPAGVDGLGVDLYRGGRLAVEHLVGHGYDRIGFLGRPGRRRDGWADALAAAGLEEVPSYDAGWTRRDGYEAAQRLLADPDRPTAVFTHSDEIAVGTVRATHEAGVRIPDDLALVSFDGTASAEYSWPAITTVRQPIQEMAREAVHRLLDPDAPSGYHRYTAELLVRASCGC